MALSQKKEIKSSVYYSHEIIEKIQSLVEEEIGHNDESMEMMRILEIKTIGSQPSSSRDMDQRMMMINEASLNKEAFKKNSTYVSIMIYLSHRHWNW